MYSTEADVSVLSNEISFLTDEVNNAIAAADKEINAGIGQRYALPIVTAPGTVAELALNRISAHLAAGMLITARSTGSELTEVHAYGLYLLRLAREGIKEIRDGEVELPGIIPVEGPTGSASGPLYTDQGTDGSATDQYYAAFGNPASIVATGFASTTAPQRRIRGYFPC